MTFSAILLHKDISGGHRPSRPSYIMKEFFVSWWRHHMKTFSALLAICVGNSQVTGEFPAQRPVTRSFDVFFDRRLNKRLSKQSWGRWFETPYHPLWRHCNYYWHLTQWSPLTVLTTQRACNKRHWHDCALQKQSLIASFMGPTWGPPGANRTQVGPMSASWTLLYGMPSSKRFD